MRPVKKRGRPVTRNQPALLYAVWRWVRAELALQEAKNVKQACAAIMERWGSIRFTEAGSRVVDIVDAEKLRQWYAAAEKARVNDAELDGWCASWEADLVDRWPDMSAAISSSKELREAQRAGLNDTVKIIDQVDAAVTRARSVSMSPRTPRKHRR